MASKHRDNRVLVGELVSRAGIEAARAASLATEAAIRDSVMACDYDTAAMRVFALARPGTPAPAAVAAVALAGIEWWPIACALIAASEPGEPRATALLDVLARRRFPGTRDAIDIETIALYAAFRAGAERARVIPILRRIAARAGTAEGYALLETMAIALADPHVTAACKPFAGYAREYAASITEIDKALARTLDAILESLPAEIDDPRAGGMTVRAAKPAGRNDPCPCGSGNKYKKCCADKPTGTPSPVAGVTWDDFLAARADQITAAHAATLPLRDLSRIELANVTDETLRELAHRFLLARAWHHAERTADESERRGTSEERYDLREELIYSVFGAGDRELAMRHVRAMPEASRAHWAVDLAVDDGPAQAWAALVTAADAAVRGDSHMAYVDLAYSLLHAVPTLGIVAARACIGGVHFDDPDLLLEQVEEIRDELNLPPIDPAWTVLDLVAPPTKQSKRGKKAAAEADAESAKLRAQLTDSSTRAEKFARELETMQLELARARAAASQRHLAPELEAASVLASKVANLEAMIREGNAERRELRKALTEATELTEAPPPAPRGRNPDVDAHDVEAEDRLGEAVAVMARPLAFPTFEKRAMAAFRDVPAAVAAEAMKTIGALAAGDFPTWRGVKQAKDMPVTVLMARVGIHHRLIMKSDGGSLDVLDLITRESLMTTLKRIRSNG